MASMKQWVTEATDQTKLVWGPMVAVYAPKGLLYMYFNKHIRRCARRMLKFLDPYVTIDIVGARDEPSSKETSRPSNNAYKEVEAYLTKLCARNVDAHAFRAEGTVHQGHSGFLLTLHEGQEVTDNFQGVTVWWSSRKEASGCLRLMFPQQHRELILDRYLPHVRQKGREDFFVTIDIVDKGSHDTRDDLKVSEAFEEVKAYLNSRCTGDALELDADGTVRGDSFLLSLREGQEVADKFNDHVTVWWSSLTRDTHRRETIFRLVFPQQQRALILDQYLPHVRQTGRNIMVTMRGQRLYTNKKFIASWSHIDFEHPTTFDTLAMPHDKKRKIMEDLDNFRGSKDNYRRFGKPWKRGYLLYGPPGTGKSTMIAAMANYLNYDIYDVELTSLKKNSDLRRLLLETTGKSIIVFEDIDCCFDHVTGQRSNPNQEGANTSSRSYRKDDDNCNVTLSGLLNCIDGIWSPQTDERIIVLTTNFRDKLDPALVRSGRMDKHIEMSYCCFEAFQTLAMNYLSVSAHPLFQRVEELLRVVEITPADVTECFLRSQNDHDDDGNKETCIRRLIDQLENKLAKPKNKRQRRH